MKLEDAIEGVLLGESLRSIRSRLLMEELGVYDEDGLATAFRKLDHERATKLQSETLRFVGTLCRVLGERHERDMRICTVIEVWVRETKDYDAFDALLSNFDWPGRARCLDQGRRLFPSTLTAHWEQEAY